jgi:hypothetical protein|tara:strand:+ start:245 stop:502 length:258 start_codon:yes stop_codon:yes gene_type:complete
LLIDLRLIYDSDPVIRGIIECQCLLISIKKRLKRVKGLVNWGDCWAQAFIDSASVIDPLMIEILAVIWGICSVLLGSGGEQERVS